MWSDPDDIERWGVSPRGAGWLFGGSVTREVCPPFSSLFFVCDARAVQPVSSLSPIARARQLVQERYELIFDEALATVWSVPNTATAVRTWLRFSQFERTERVAPRYDAHHAL
ncbi:hypothetical protein BC827DRAFT_740791 [Russula dissimulans]|nr:hypothetical protein BC827DRAFT_740791 [Russula dissimulans]